jgi:Tol biopolymer transport system component
LLTTAVTLASLVPWVVQLRKPVPRERTIRFSISPSDEVAVQDYAFPSISPDGDRLVFVGLTSDGGRRLWIRALDSLRAELLSGTELAESAFWSPDSKVIAFFAGGKLKTIDPNGPPSPSTLCDAPGVSPAGSWSRKGTILFQTRAHPQLYKVAKGGGEPQPATILDASREEIAHYAPQFLPDGRHFIYFVQSARPENTGIYVGELDSNRSSLLVNSNVNAAYAENAGSGYVLFTKGTTLVGQRFNPSTRQLAGTPFPVAEQLLVSMASGLGRAMFSASANGVLAYRTGADTGSTELVWFDRHGNRLRRVGESADYSNPALSPDEKKLAVARVDSATGTRDLWVLDLIRETSSRFTFDPADDTNPVWSPDGTRLAFTTVRNGRPEIYQKDVSGSSDPTLFLASGQSMSIQDWSRDGRFLVYWTSPGTWVQSLAVERSSIMLLGQGTGKMSANAEVSPDGRWVAYQLNEPNRSEIYVESLRPNGGKWQVSTAGGMEPHWRRDGKELFYIAGQKLMAVEVRGDAGVFEVASPKALFEVRLENMMRRSRYQVAANGQRFLINVPVQSSSPFTVVVNWTVGRRP